MTDKELLELAAKAAGIDRGADRLDCGILVTEKTGRRSLPKWNPLESDGDAFRLAVQLGLMIVVWRDEQMSYAGNEIGYGWVAEDWDGMFEPHDDNPFTATRRAIVREAAKIGSRMP